MNSTSGTRAGVPIGETLEDGGGLRFDVAECYTREERGAATGPNGIVWGRLGRGKSTLMNVYLWAAGVGVSAWARVRRLVVAHPGMQATSRHARALAPLDSVASLGQRGAYIGDMLYGGGGFHYDAWECYARQKRTWVTDPNLTAWGRLGRGKSATMKVYLRRQWCFGRRIRVIDTHTRGDLDQGEYTPLIKDLGGVVVRLARNGGVRLNPLDDPEDRHHLLRRLARSVLPRPLGDGEPALLNTALDWVCTGREVPILPEVIEALFHPTDWMAERLAMTARRYKSLAEGVALALHPLCAGDLRGMFDGPTTPGIDFDAQALSIDLSGLKDSESLAILMSCATACLQATMTRRHREYEALNARRLANGEPLVVEPSRS